MTQGPGHYCDMENNERICKVQKDVEASNMWEWCVAVLKKQIL